jgi:hypothetical protein
VYEKGGREDWRQATAHAMRCGLMALAASAPVAPWACGLDDASDVALQRVAMGLAFPGSASVLEASRKAQVQGVLPREARPARSHSAKQGQRALDAVRAQVQILASQWGASRDTTALQPPVAIVLLQPMLWSRLSPQADSLRADVHVDGPQPGDLVVVTDMPALQALAAKTLTFSQALQLGLVRLYGATEASRSPPPEGST